MAVKIKMELDKHDVRKFQHALLIYKNATGKDARYVVNRAAMNVAFRAIQNTKEADLKDPIPADLKRPWSDMRNPWNLTLWNLRKQGIHPKILKTSDIRARARKMIASRKRARAFIRAGWLPAAKALKAIVRAGAPGGALRGVRRRPGKGSAKPAFQTVRPVAEITNASTSKSASSPAALSRWGGPGLARAVRFVTDDMLQYARGLLEKRARAFNRG